MFGKKILSIVGLLFASTIVTASFEDCQPTYSDPTCTPGTCTNGDDGYYLAKSTGELVKVENSATSATCSLVTDNGYYVLAHSKGLKSLKGSTVEDANGADSGCSGGSDAGKFYDGSVLCLDQDKPLSLSDETNSYLLKDSGSVFYESEANKHVIVKSTGTSVVIDNELMSYYRNYCVDENKIVRERKADFCSNARAADCDYYSCKNGYCTNDGSNIKPANEVRISAEACNLDSPDAEKCVDGGYYIYDSDADKTPLKVGDDATNVAIVQCSSQGGWSCGTPTPAITGYLVNAAKDDEFIECVANECTAVAAVDTKLANVETNGVHMINIKKANVDDTVPLLGITKTEGDKYVTFTKNDLGIILTTVTEGYYTITEANGQTIIDDTKAGDLYNCAVDSGVSKCDKIDNSQKPIGYLKNAGDATVKTFIKCDVSGVCQAIQPGSESSCSTNHGDLYIVSGATKLCGIANNDSDLVLAGAGAITGEKYYFASVSTENDGLFGIKYVADYSIVLKFEDGNVVVDNSQVRYRYTKTGETEIKSRTGAYSENSAGGICHYDSDNEKFDIAFEYILATWATGTSFTEGIAYYVDEEFEKST